MRTDEEKKKDHEYYLKNRTKIINYSKEYAKSHLEKRREIGLRNYYKNREKCIERSKKWKEKNPEKAKLHGRQYSARNPGRSTVWCKNNAERAKQHGRKYYLKHKQERNAANRKWGSENKEWKLEYNRRWVSNNRSKVRVYHQNRRALELGAIGKFEQSDIDKQYKNQNGKCYWCKIEITTYYHIDHVWPLSKGGSNGPENIVIACKKCNSHKQARTPIEFAGVLL